MKRNDFLNLLEDILETDENIFTGDEELEALASWNSLTKVSLIAMVDEKFDITLAPSNIDEFKTIQDIVDILGDKIVK